MTIDSATLHEIRAEAKKKGVRWTTQRQAVLELLANCGEHLTVEEIQRRTAHRNVSPATAYRTINMLVEMGAVSKRDFGASSASFEWNIAKLHHDHLVCTSCGAITEFVNDRIEELQDTIAAQHGYILSRHRLDLFGICPSCQRSAKKIKIAKK